MSSRSTARARTRCRRTRSTRKGLWADGINGKLLPQDWGRDVIHGRDGSYTALEDFVSKEGQGERIQGSDMHKVSSDVRR